MPEDLNATLPPERSGTHARGIVAAAALLGLVQLAMFSPGIAVFDSINQYGQAMSGHYDDWHPPIMARLWAGLGALGLHGTAPMLVLQLGIFWVGLALIGMAVARWRPGAGWAVLIVGLLPIVANWMIVIVKDVGLVAALTGATGIVALYRMRERKMPWWAIGVVLILLAYAVLVRANSAFATVPLAWSWQGWAGMRRWWARAALALLTLVAVFGASRPIDHHVLGAHASHVENTLPVFDLAGIAHFAPLGTVPGVSPAQWRKVTTHRCYMPFYWDPFADRTRCGDIGDMMTDEDVIPSLGRLWVEEILAHPIAYAEHRLAHLNSTLRIWVPADEPSTAAPALSDSNDWRIGGTRTPRADALATVTKAIARTPLGAPATWLALAIGLFWMLLGTPEQPARALGLSLSLSGIAMTASFAVVSIASDMRYHLWLFVCTGLAAAMLVACRDVPRRPFAVVAAVLLVLCAIEGIARLTLPAFIF